MVAFADALSEGDSSYSHVVHFATGESGVHVVLDTEFGTRTVPGHFKEMTENLEKDRLLKWESTLNQRRAILKEKERQSETLRALQEGRLTTHVKTVDDARLARLASRAKLQSMGATAYVDADSIDQEIMLVLESMLSDVEAVLEPHDIVIAIGVDSTDFEK